VHIPGTRRIVLTVAIAFSAVGTAVAAVPAAQASPATTAARRFVIINCTNHWQVKPNRFVLACADGNEFLKKLTWSHWAATASGKGTDAINSCVPSCVAGHFHGYPVKVYLWRTRQRPRHPGQWYYTRMTLTYTGKVPSGFHRHRTVNLWAKI
jgi:hypothetical protein